MEETVDLIRESVEIVSKNFSNRNYVQIKIIHYQNVGWCSAYNFYLNNHSEGAFPLPKWGVFESRDEAFFYRLDLFENRMRECLEEIPNSDARRSSYASALDWAISKRQLVLF